MLLNGNDELRLKSKIFLQSLEDYIFANFIFPLQTFGVVFESFDVLFT